MNSHLYEIEIKKILLSSLQTGNFPIHTSIIEILQLLMQLYQTSSEELYLKNAAQFILAYLELGFSYMEHQSLFDEILIKNQFSSQEINLLHRRNPPVPLTRTGLRSVIGKWPVSTGNSHTIGAAINEIIQHVLFQDLGVFYYFTAKKDGTRTALYQLTVYPDYALFHDVFQNKFYQLTKQ